MKIKKTLVIILTIFLSLSIYRNTFAQTVPDTSSVDVGSWKIKIETANFGMVTRAEVDEESNAILKVDPIMSAGLSLCIFQADKSKWGLEILGLFYTDAEKVYPIAAIGGSLLNITVAMGYDFGKIMGENNCKNRLLFMVTYNPFD